MKTYFNYTDKVLCDFQGNTLNSQKLYPRIPIGFKPVMELHILERTSDGYTAKNLSYLSSFEMAIDKDFDPNTHTMTETANDGIVSTDKANGVLSIKINATLVPFKTALGNSNEIQATLSIIGKDSEGESVELVEIPVYAKNVIRMSQEPPQELIINFYNKTETQALVSQMIAEALENYTPSATQFTVTFNADGGIGTLPSNITQNSGTTVTIPASTLTKSGFTFGGWTDGITTYHEGETMTLNQAITLTAIWVAVVITYTVTFNGNGNTGGTIPSSITQNANTVVTVPTSTVAKTGNTLTGWTNGTTTYTAGQTFTLTANVTLTAVWTVASSPTFADWTNFTGWLGFDQSGNQLSSPTNIPVYMENGYMTLTDSGDYFLRKEITQNGFYEAAIKSNENGGSGTLLAVENKHPNGQYSYPELGYAKINPIGDIQYFDSDENWFTSLSSWGTYVSGYYEAKVRIEKTNTQIKTWILDPSDSTWGLLTTQNLIAGETLWLKVGLSGSKISPITFQAP